MEGFTFEMSVKNDGHLLDGSRNKLVLLQQNGYIYLPNSFTRLHIVGSKIYDRQQGRYIFDLLVKHYFLYPLSERLHNQA